MKTTNNFNLFWANAAKSASDAGFTRIIFEGVRVSKNSVWACIASCVLSAIQSFMYFIILRILFCFVGLFYWLLGIWSVIKFYENIMVMFFNRIIFIKNLALRIWWYIICLSNLKLLYIRFLAKSNGFYTLLLNVWFSYYLNKSVILLLTLRVSFSVVNISIDNEDLNEIFGVCPKAPLAEEQVFAQAVCNEQKLVSQKWDYRYCFSHNVIKKHRLGFFSPECCQMWGVYWHRDYFEYMANIKYGIYSHLDIVWRTEYKDPNINPDLLPRWFLCSPYRFMDLAGFEIWERLYYDIKRNNITDIEEISLKLLNSDDTEVSQKCPRENKESF